MNDFERGWMRFWTIWSYKTPLKEFLGFWFGFYSLSVVMKILEEVLEEVLIWIWKMILETI